MTSILQWIAGGAVGLLATIALANSTATSTNIADLQTIVATHSTEISNLKYSECIQNENMRNLASAVHASFVSDPNCN